MGERSVTSNFQGNSCELHQSCFGLWSEGLDCVVAEDRLKVQIQEFITHICPQETAISNIIRFALHFNFLLLTIWHQQE